MANLDKIKINGITYGIVGSGGAYEYKTTTWNGLTIVFAKCGNIVRVSIGGTLTANVATSNAYAAAIPYPTGYVPAFNSAMYGIITNLKSGLIYARTNGLRIGYTKYLSTGEDCNLSSGELIYWCGTYPIE